MIFNLCSAIVPQSILWLSLNHLIYKVCSLDGPPPGHLALFDLHLLREDVVPDLFPRLSNIRALAKHALIGHDAHGEVVDSSCVVLAAHDLGSHVTWSTRSVLSVLWPPNSRDTEVSYTDVSIVIDNQVLGFYISMDDLLLVAVLETCYQARDKEP